MKALNEHKKHINAKIQILDHKQLKENPKYSFKIKLHKYG